MLSCTNFCPHKHFHIISHVMVNEYQMVIDTAINLRSHFLFHVNGNTYPRTYQGHELVYVHGLSNIYFLSMAISLSHLILSYLISFPYVFKVSINYLVQQCIMLVATIELHSHNIILGCGSIFNTHVNSNIIVYGHIIINTPIYSFFKELVFEH